MYLFKQFTHHSNECMQKVIYSNSRRLYSVTIRSPPLPWSQFFLSQFSRSVVSDSWRPHESQHARLPYPSQTPGVYSNSCPLSRWCHPAISSSVIPFSSCPESLPASESTLRMRWPKYWSFSFSISPSNEHPGLISFRMDWLDLHAVQGTLKESPPTPQFKSIDFLVLSFLHSPTLKATLLLFAFVSFQGYPGIYNHACT